MRKTYAFFKEESFGQMLSKKGWDFLFNSWLNNV